MRIEGCRGRSRIWAMAVLLVAVTCGWAQESADRRVEGGDGRRAAFGDSGPRSGGAGADRD